jgi:alpha 1,2-mannosyltransferase
MYQSLSLADGKKARQSSNGKTWRIVLLVFVAFFLFTYKRRHDNALEGNELVYRKPTMKSKITSIIHKPKQNKDWPSLHVLQEFWTDLAVVLESTKPTNAPPKHAQEPPSIIIDGADQYTLEMNETEIETMRDAHRRFVQQASSLSLLNTYKAGTRGIVTTAGGRYIPIFLVSLRLLRRTGSTLPVEVFLANDEEYDADLCEKVLPTLNARCRVLTHVLSAANNVKISSYQFKIFALLFSSFEDNLFIDADNLVINDPLPMLTNEPFASTGMVSTVV